MTSEQLRAEFTIEPWVESGHPRYVEAAISVIGASECALDVGPFGIGAEGFPATLYDLVPRVLEAAFSNGAIRVSLQVSRLDDT